VQDAGKNWKTPSVLFTSEEIHLFCQKILLRKKTVRDFTELRVFALLLKSMREQFVVKLEDFESD